MTLDKIRKDRGLRIHDIAQHDHKNDGNAIWPVYIRDPLVQPLFDNN